MISSSAIRRGPQMKHTLIALFMGAILLSSVAAEEVVIDTPYEDEVTLTIPEDYETLREYYIELAELYQETKYDLDQEIDNVDALLVNQEELLALVREDKKLLNEIKNDLKQPTLPEFLNHGPLVGVGTSIDHPYTIHAGYSIEILNSFTLQLQGQFPFGVSVMVGWEF
jgi:hypothetical protein